MSVNKSDFFMLVAGPGTPYPKLPKTGYCIGCCFTGAAFNTNPIDSIERLKIEEPTVSCRYSFPGCYLPRD